MARKVNKWNTIKIECNETQKKKVEK